MKRKDGKGKGATGLAFNYHKKKSQPKKNQEPAFHPLFVNPKKVEFENFFVPSYTAYLIDGKLSE